MIGAEVRAPQWLVETLAEHQLVSADQYGWKCCCGHKGSAPEYLLRAHLAYAITAALAELLDGSFDHAYDRGEGDAQGYRHRDKQVRTVLGIGGAL